MNKLLIGMLPGSFRMDECSARGSFYPRPGKRSVR